MIEHTCLTKNTEHSSNYPHVALRPCGHALMPRHGLVDNATYWLYLQMRIHETWLRHVLSSDSALLGHVIHIYIYICLPWMGH